MKSEILNQNKVNRFVDSFGFKCDFNFGIGIDYRYYLIF